MRLSCRLEFVHSRTLRKQNMYKSLEMFNTEGNSESNACDGKTWGKGSSSTSCKRGVG